MKRERLRQIANGDEPTKEEAEELAFIPSGSYIMLLNSINREPSMTEEEHRKIESGL